jgi:hypothetical protein
MEIDCSIDSWKCESHSSQHWLCSYRPDVGRYGLRSLLFGVAKEPLEELLLHLFDMLVQLRRLDFARLLGSPFEVAFLLGKEAASGHSGEVLTVGDVPQLLVHAFNNNFIAGRAPPVYNRLSR